MSHTENSTPTVTAGGVMTDDTKSEILAVALEDAAMQSSNPPPHIRLDSDVDELLSWLRWGDPNGDHGSLATADDAWEAIAEMCEDGR